MGNIQKTISYLKRNGLLKTVRMSIQRINEERMEKDYESERSFLTATAGELLAQENHRFKDPLLLSLVIPAYETPPEYLRMLLDSILVQSYGRFEIVLADASESDAVRDVVAEYDDERLVYIKLDKNGGISENTNCALEKAGGEAVVFIDHDDFLEPDALFHIARSFDEGADLVYTDEDKFCDGRYFRPHRKPDYNYDLLLSNNYISHLFAARTQLVKKAGMLRSEFDGAQDFDLILRLSHLVMEKTGFYQGECTDVYKRIVHVPRILYHWRVHNASTAENPSAKSYAYEAGRRAVSEHLRNVRGIECRVRHTDHLGFYLTDYRPLPEEDTAALHYHLPRYSKPAGGINYHRMTSGIFQRPEVKTVVYKIAGRDGRVCDGPYAGLKWWDSDVMHMAAVDQDLYEGSYRACCYCSERTKGLTVFMPRIIFHEG